MLIATGVLVQFLLALLVTLTEGVTWHELKAALGKRRHLQWVRDLQPLVQDQLLYASELPLAEQETFHDVLRNILVPRTVGSPGHRKVRQFLQQSMEQLDWHVEEDRFEAPTPHGNKVFSNIVATLDPSACHRLVLACHYDSMVHKHGVFLGATDSAVPCAQLIYLATVLNDKLQEQTRRGDGLTVQLIFFDGEEAFVRWSSSDSLYGSRHLASLWHRNSTQGYNLEGCLPRSDIATQIDRMEVMVLLDLLGASGPQFYSYFVDTRPVYDRLVDIDVPIVHVIPSPFPDVWHTLEDNEDNLDYPTINNLNKIFKAFLTEYLRL
ncbi:glutaminyl-peptide cyclotransferase isoform X3 [Rhipicephalus sanguineus]|uniref:glutaminyl-peptide cyclotransferase isoform X3 n=1 Tax=Rhipicephalus sanguineus TaxID=34632 RepID=UPI0020C389B4|nr:glutaminyl-peptide cyclotransferase isoform X3 [Rhipicephalus sanguineus]